jgi:hypothetical protein
VHAMFPGMKRPGDAREGWTAHQVEIWLIAAFVAVKDHPVFSGAPTILPVNALAPGHREVLAWAHLVKERRDREMLLAWARCQATSDSFGALCRGLEWPRRTAEDARRRALAQIVQGLNAALALDSRNDRPGASEHDGAEKGVLAEV